MQGLWNETQTTRSRPQYWSCVPYLLGEGQAMMYSVRPQVEGDAPASPVCRSASAGQLSARRTWSRRSREQDVEFDILVQVQTDPHRMPIENAAVRWPETALALRPGRDAAHPPAEVDWPAQLALRPQAVAQPVALHPGAPPARQPEPRARRMYWELPVAADGRTRLSRITSRLSDERLDTVSQDAD